MDSIFSVLARDHQHCDALFVQACADVRAGDWGASSRSVPRLVEALRRHLHAEEEIVFEAFDAAVNTDPLPTASLRAEHQRVLGVLHRVLDSLAARDASAFFKHAATLRVLLQYHHEKEESVFYPAAERILRGRREELLMALREFDGLTIAA